MAVAYCYSPTPTRRNFRRASGSGRIEVLNGFVELGSVGGTHHARDLPPVAQEDERGPELDEERAPERLAFAIFDPAVLHVAMLGKGAIDERAGALADRAPTRAKLEHDLADQASGSRLMPLTSLLTALRARESPRRPASISPSPSHGPGRNCPVLT